jgi:ribokinase
MRAERGGDPASAEGGVVIVGSITADVTTFSDRLPARGETVLGTDLTLVLGGKGANQAVAAARAGAHAYLVGCVGDDVFGPLVTDGLRENGVDLADVHVIEGPTGVAHIRVDATGENDIVIVPLANASLSEDHVDSAIESLAGRASVLLTQLEIPSAITVHAIGAAHAAGLTVVLDPAPALPLGDEIWQLVDIVTPNESEASRYTGIPVVDFDSAIAAGRWFCSRGARNAIITLASLGAVLVTESKVVRFAAYPIKAVDTTAAGDAFAGYLGAALARGLELESAISLAMAAGALAVTKRGASPSLPMATDVERFLAMQHLTA